MAFEDFLERIYQWVSDYFLKQNPTYIIYALSGFTTFFGFLLFSFVLIYGISNFKKYREMKYMIPEEQEAPKSLIAKIGSFLLRDVLNVAVVVLDVVMSAAVFMSALLPYHAYQPDYNLSEHLYIWIKNGTLVIDGPLASGASAHVLKSQVFNSPSFRFGGYLAVLSTVLLVYAIAVPWVLTWAFTFSYQGKRYTSYKSERTNCLTTAFWWVIGLLFGIPRFLLVKLFTFALSYFSKSIVALCITLPVKVIVTVRSEFVFLLWYTLILGLMMCCFTIQGFWVATARVKSYFKLKNAKVKEAVRQKRINRAQNPDADTVSLLSHRQQRASYYSTTAPQPSSYHRPQPLVTESSYHSDEEHSHHRHSRRGIYIRLFLRARNLVLLVFVFQWSIIKHVYRLMVGFPEPQVLPSVNVCTSLVFCCPKDREIMEEEELVRSTPVTPISPAYASASTSNEVITSPTSPSTTNTQQWEVPPLIDWMSFCSSYSVSFFTPIPTIGPFLYLISSTMSKSGVWLCWAWLFTNAKYNTSNKEFEQIQSKDWLKKYFWSRYDPLYKVRTGKDGVQHDGEQPVKFIDEEDDRGRILRIGMLVVIPLIAALAFIRPQGFDLSSTMLDVVYNFIDFVF